MAWSTETFDVTCDKTGLAQTVSIGLPVRHANLERAPLLLCLDGPWLFGTTLDATRIMSMSGEAPEAIVVGLSFTTDSMSEYINDRGRWLTPTPWVPPEITGVKGISADECGRADELLRFIADQILPLVEAEHIGPLGVSERWLIGHSFSALFGVRTLFAAPGLFDKWLLASPSIWWDGRTILSHESDYAERHSDLRAQVFVSYGELEHETPPGFDINLGRDADEFVERLRSRNYPGLQLTRAVMAGDAHSSSIGPAISKGIRALQAPAGL